MNSSNNTTVKSIFSTIITDFYISQCSNHLSEWLKTNKGVNVTAEELCGAFNVPCIPSCSMAGLPQAASMATQMPNLGSQSKPKPRKRTNANPNGPKCIYQFQRGNKKGKICGDSAAQTGAPGSDEYCKACLKKKTVQNKINNGTSKSTVQPPVLPGGMVAMEKSQQPSGSGTINAVPIDGYDDLFKDVERGYILKQYPDGALAALSIEVDGVQRPLNAQEKREAQVIGLSVVDSPQQSVQVSQVVAPAVIPTSQVVATAAIPTSQGAQVVQPFPVAAPVAPVPQVIPQAAPVAAPVSQVIPQAAPVAAPVSQVIPQLAAPVPQVIPQVAAPVPQVIPQVAPVPQVIPQVIPTAQVAPVQ